MDLEEQILQTLSLSAEHYRQVQTKGSRSFALRRGVIQRVHDLLGMGCGHPDHPLGESLPGPLHPIAKTLGLLYESGDDAMRERLVIPIQDPLGRVIAMTGRLMEAGEPRYYNTHKVEIEPGIRGPSAKDALLGLFQARESIRRKGLMVLVEGPLDMAVAWSNRLSNAVASMGTNLSAAQVRLVGRCTEKVVILFDEPKVNRRDPDSVEKAEQHTSLIEDLIDELDDLGVEAVRICLPEGLDPADYFQGRSGAR